MKFKKFLLSIILVSSFLVGCTSNLTQISTSQNDVVESDLNTENTAQSSNESKKISVASVAISQILADMNVDIVGRPTTKLTLPEEYLNIPEIGTSFSPDFEKVLSTGTELLIGDVMFKDKIEKTAQEYGIETFYVDTSEYEKFLISIDELGQKIGKQKEATEIVEKFKKPLQNINITNKNLKVAIIIGSSESNMLATENTYLGSLVKALGVKNIATEIINNTSSANNSNNVDGHLGSDSSGYINLNLEQLLKNEPDIILAFGHGNIDASKKAFEKLFNESGNTAWKNLNAVKNNKVYYLDSNIFGTSANNLVDKALTELGEILNEK